MSEPQPARSPGHREWLEALVENSAEGFLVLSAEGIITFATPAVTEILGYPRDRLIGTRGLDLVHPDDHPVVEGQLDLLYAQPGQRVPIEVRVRHAAGSWVTVAATTVNLLDNPDIGGFICNFRDITARREAEAALRASEERFRALVQSSSDAMIVVRETGVVDYASPALEHIFGRPLEEILGRSGLDWLHPDDRDVVAAKLADLVTEPGASTSHQFRLLDGDGRWRWADATVVNMLHDDAIGGLVCNVRDITEQKQAEAALKASEARFRTVIGNSYDVTLVVDRDAVIRWVTPNVERLFGYRPDDIVGTNAFAYLHPDNVRDMLTELANFVQGRGVPNPTEIQVRSLDGTWIPVEIVGTDLLDHPEIRGIALGLRDVRDRVKAESERQRLIDVLELSADLVGICDANGRVQYLNRAARDFFGLAPDQPATAVDLGSLVPPENLEQFARYIDLEGIWSGELVIGRHDGTPVATLAQILVHRDDAGEPEYYSAVLRDISERKRFESQLAHQASHDPLTGLPNRTLLLDRLEMALARTRRHSSSVGVLFLDLDNFKVVNDSLGHSLGDVLLAAIARRLESTLRPGDTIARFGGDEFVILCEEIDRHEDALVIGKRVEHALAEGFELDGNQIYIEASIGVAFADGPNVDPESLIRDADAAMYQAKRFGRARIEVFDATMREEVIDRLSIEGSLRAAVGTDALRLVYQPIYSLRDGAIRAVEALVRWRHPERGELLPHEFIPVAEESGLIFALGDWVLREAALQLRSWESSHPHLPPFTLNVNLSGRQLSHQSLTERVVGVLHEVGVPGSRMQVEVTESVLMHDVETTQQALDRLRQEGIGLAVDDFGTGYSSLSYLRNFPIDSLKIDQRFVAGLGVSPQDTSIVAAVVNLAHTLGLEAVAEGVESAAQMADLIRLGCDAAQGFYLGRPVEGSELPSMLSSRGVRARGGSGDAGEPAVI